MTATYLMEFNSSTLRWSSGCWDGVAQQEFICTKCERM